MYSPVVVQSANINGRQRFHQNIQAEFLTPGFLLLADQYKVSQETMRYSKEYIFLINNVSGASSC
jgi:hypothetical protein